MAKSDSILLGGGCFWCVEAIFKDLKGILSVTPGYGGGTLANPDYEQVCTGKTGHAEIVKITYDPDVLPLGDLLRIFFTTHDPTQKNRQGHDIGTQYRSVIFGNKEQQETARLIKEEIEKAQIWPAPIVTSIEGPTHFWEAESYHHDYFAKNPYAGYCQAVIGPKLAKARKLYQHYFRN